MNWYHGSSKAVEGFESDAGKSDEPDMMFFSASCNVARRYGRHVGKLELEATDFPRMSIEEWFSGKHLPEENFVISGDEESFDFPVDTLVLRKDPGAVITPMGREEILSCDDGRAIREPASRRDREWQLYVSDLYGGDEKSWERDTGHHAGLTMS